MTAGMTLSGHRVLVVENEYFIAMDVLDRLSMAGATIVGPIAELASALCHIAHDGFDAAVFNIRLNDGHVFPAADQLARSRRPFMFLPGYDRQFIPERFSATPLLSKPFDGGALVEVLCELLSKTAASADHEE